MAHARLVLAGVGGAQGATGFRMLRLETMNIVGYSYRRELEPSVASSLLGRRELDLMRLAQFILAT